MSAGEESEKGAERREGEKVSVGSRGGWGGGREDADRGEERAVVVVLSHGAAIH